jgi:hypothetical protein
MVPQADQQPRCMPRPVRPIGKMALPFYNMRVWDALGECSGAGTRARAIARSPR